MIFIAITIVFKSIWQIPNGLTDRFEIVRETIFNSFKPAGEDYSFHVVK